MSVTSLSGLSSFNPTTLLRRGPNSGSETGPFAVEKPKSSDESQSTASILNTLGLDGLQNEANIFQSVNLSASRSEFSASGPGFRLGGFTEQVSFAATFQQGDQLLQLNIEVQRSVVQFAVGKQAGGGYDINGLLDRLPDDARKLVDSFLKGDKDRDFFSPENTADRIASFALRGFAFFEGGKAASEGTQEARQRYLDYITPAIEKGFKEALDILGAIPDQTRGEIQQTRSHIQERLDAFLNGGTDQEA